MCGIDRTIVDNAEIAAKEYEHTSQVKKRLETANQSQFVPLGLQSDFSWLMKIIEGESDDLKYRNSLQVILREVESL